MLFVGGGSMLPTEGRLLDRNPGCPDPNFIYDVPAVLPREISAIVCISKRAVRPMGTEVVDFQVREPNRGHH